jgi:hypothetical protein
MAPRFFPDEQLLAGRRGDIAKGKEDPDHIHYDIEDIKEYKSARQELNKLIAKLPWLVVEWVTCLGGWLYRTVIDPQELSITLGGSECCPSFLTVGNDVPTRLSISKGGLKRAFFGKNTR